MYQMLISLFSDQNILGTIPLSVLLLLGIITIAYGLHTRRHGLPMGGSIGQRWQKQLMEWHVLDPNTPSQALIDVKRCQEYLTSMTLLGAGSAIVMTVIGWFVASLTMAGSLEGVVALDFIPLAASLFFSTGMGSGIAAVTAARHLRKTAMRRVTYADLQQRRPSDYRNSVFPYIIAVMIAWTIGVICFFAPHAASTLEIDLPFTATTLAVPNNVWILSLIPCIMILLFLSVEVLLFRITGFSRLLVTSDPAVSRHADDMLRAGLIGQLLYSELAVIGYLAALPFLLLSHGLRASHYWQIGNHPYFALLAVSNFLPSLALLLGAGILGAYGHLGGSISGWPWQSKRMEQAKAE